MRSILTMTRLDLAVWRRSPWAIIVAIIPPLGMAVLVHVLSLAVTKQPVALVVADHGPQASQVASFLEADTDTYALQVTDAANATSLLDAQKVAAVITIPRDFDAKVAVGRAPLEYVVNNVDIDIADDIRRALDRSVAQLDAPQLAANVEGAAGSGGVIVPNPYLMDIAQTNLRDTDVAFETYQVLPVLLLLVISVGVLGGSLLGSRDSERRTNTFLRLAPIRSSELVLGRLLGTFIATLSIVVPAVLLLMWEGTVDPPSGHWPVFIAILLETAVMASGLGLVLGALFTRSATVALAAIIVASYLFFLGGGFTTLAFLPQWLQDISRAIPTRYAINGMRQALFYDDLSGMGTNLLALGLFAIGAVILGLFAVRRSTAGSTR